MEGAVFGLIKRIYPPKQKQNKQQSGETAAERGKSGNLMQPKKKTRAN